MAKRKRPRPDGAELAVLAETGLKYKDIAKRFGISPASVAGAIKYWRDNNQESKKLNVVDFGKPLRLAGDFIILGDIHFPTTKYTLAKLAVKVAQHYGVKRIVLAGDIYNMDFVSKYQFIVPSITWAQERDAARVVINEWLEYFDEIIFIMGNHDRRMQKFTAGAFEETDIFGLITTSEKATFSNFGYLFANSGGQDYLITHSTEYSVNQLNVADQLAQKYQMNVISHHEHHVAKGFDRFKRYVIINNGGLFDAEQMAYTKLDTSKRPNMANGFTALVDGVGHLYTPYANFTDWKHITGG